MRRCWKSCASAARSRKRSGFEVLGDDGKSEEQAGWSTGQQCASLTRCGFDEVLVSTDLVEDRLKSDFWREVTRPFYETTPLIGSESRSEEHTSELQSLMRISYAVFCLKKKKKIKREKHKEQCTITE